MAWEITTFGGGEFLWELFNGLNALMEEDGFSTVIRLSGLISLLWVMLEVAFFRRSPNLNWLIGYILVYNVIFAPRADIVIVDKLDPAHSDSVIANTPRGLAVFASVTSSLGATMTEWVEGVLTLPDDLKYHQSGMVLGASLVSAAQSFEVTDANLQASLSSFMQECVYYDLLMNK